MENIFKRRSIRRYKNVKVESEKIEKLLRAATQNILLEAVELGLGSVWIGVAPGEERMNYIRDIFKLNENIKPYAVVAVGYPMMDEENKFIDRYDETKVHYENY